MSQLVARWDNSYRLDDGELASLLDLQSAINATFLPVVGAGGDGEEEADSPDRLHHYADWFHRGGRGAAQPARHDTPFAELQQQSATMDRLRASLSGLLASTGELKGAHEQVKGKSILMQSLWEGLLQQQTTFVTFAERIEARLGLFTDYDRLEGALRVGDPLEDPLQPPFVAALGQCIGHTRELAGKPEYKEGAVHLFRYKSLLGGALSAVKTLYDRRMAELILAGKEQASPVDHRELSERYGLVAGELRPLLVAVKAAGPLDGSYGQLLHDMLSRYLGSRYELSKRSRTLLEPGTVEAPQKLLASAIELLTDERDLFDAFFGLSPDLQRHYDYFCEQVLLGVVERLRLLVDATDARAIRAWIGGQRGSVWRGTLLPPFGDRLLDLVEQYCSSKTA